MQRCWCPSCKIQVKATVPPGSSCGICKTGCFVICKTCLQYFNQHSWHFQTSNPCTDTPPPGCIYLARSELMRINMPEAVEAGMKYMCPQCFVMAKKSASKKCPPCNKYYWVACINCSRPIPSGKVKSCKRCRLREAQEAEELEAQLFEGKQQEEKQSQEDSLSASTTDEQEKSHHKSKRLVVFFAGL